MRRPSASTLLMRCTCVPSLNWKGGPSSVKPPTSRAAFARDRSSERTSRSMFAQLFVQRHRAILHGGLTRFIQKCRFSIASSIMAKETQISAQISETTREIMEKHVRQTGVKKGHLIEQALLHHLQALDELPAEYIVHPRLVASRKTAKRTLRHADSAKPTPSRPQRIRDGD